MEMRWSLDELYKSFDDTNYINDLKRFNHLIKEINIFSEKSTRDYKKIGIKIEKILNFLIEYQNTYVLLESFSYLTLSVDTKNNNAVKSLEKLDKMNTELRKPMVRFSKWLASINNLDEIINEKKLLKEHRFFLEELIDKSKYLLSEEEELIISNMEITGSKLWEKLQADLTSTLLVKIELNNKTEELPLSVIRNMANDPNSDIRQKAYTAELNSYRSIEDSITASLNGIKGEVINISRIRGYNSVLEKTLLDSRMDKESLEIMLTVLKEKLPTFRRYYRKKAELLGHNEGLPFYDLFAPITKTEKSFTYPEAEKYIIEKFSTFSNKLAEYAANAFKKKWIDAEPRKGKMGGAFCAGIHPIGESRILSNFSGSYSDISTLAHELGHGYHGFCLKDVSILNADYPMPLAETASIFCQTIVDQAAIEDGDTTDVLNILEYSLADAGQVIVDIYSRYLFESKLFEMRKESYLSVDELKELMLWAQKESYGSGLNHEYLHPYMWICKSHYYSVDLNFYNFPYAFGLLFAKGLYARYQKYGDDFIKKYDQILKATGRMKIPELAKYTGIDIQQRDFWEDSLAIIESDINHFIKLSSEL